MDVAGSVALVTGANGGIERAFVAALLKRGAAKISRGAKTSRYSGRAAERLRASYQLQDGQGARPNRTTVATSRRRRGD
jgi:NAD(P)-dependent dehydrogenase (short-subunit alcohol dehydrogenase family)